MQFMKNATYTVLVETENSNENQENSISVICYELTDDFAFIAPYTTNENGTINIDIAATQVYRNIVYQNENEMNGPITILTANLVEESIDKQQCSCGGQCSCKENCHCEENK